MATPANICIHLIFPETRVIGLYFAADIMGLEKRAWLGSRDP